MEYKLGALPNLKDLRDINIAQVQQPVSIPSEYFTDISMLPVLNQKALGACVGHAHALVHAYHEFIENGNVKALSPRYIYALSKKIDGYAGEGTYPRVSAGIEFLKGCATEELVVNNTDLTHSEYITVEETTAVNDDAKKHKIKGYAIINNDINSLKQAIYQNKVIVTTISVGGYTNPMVKGNLGFHRVMVYGYKGNRFYFRNSWSDSWGDKGNGYFDFENQSLQDSFAFVDLPNEIILEAKKKWKYFSPNEKTGSTGTIADLKPELVDMLDKARGLAGIPFVITSGHRTAKHNIEVGGVENSSHTQRLAVDIRARNANEHYVITIALMMAGFKRISKCYKLHIHCDIDPNKPQNVLF